MECDDVIIAYCAYKRRKQKLKKKRVWVHPLFRSPRGLDHYKTVLNDLRGDESMFFEYFRMTTRVFDALVAALGPKLRKSDTYMRDAISPEGQLAMCLRFLASGDSFGSLALLFRKGKSTIKKATYDVCDAIWERLVDSYLPNPTEATWRSNSSKFQELWQFPHCIGAIDGKHCVLQAPANSGSLCFNHKSTFSLVLLAIVDAEHKFVMVDIGADGSNSDGGIFKDSVMGKKFASNTLEIPEYEEIENAEEFGALPYVFVTDEAFALSENMVRPYPGRGLCKTKRIFNYRLSRARRIVENAFGILAARWRFYHRRLPVNKENAKKVIKASVILHNLLQILQMPVDRRNQPKTTVFRKVEPTRRAARAGCEAIAVRDAFKNLFNSPKGSVSWQESIVNKGLN